MQSKFFSEKLGHNYFDSKSLLDFCITYDTHVRNLCVQSSDLPHLQVVLMSCVRFFLFFVCHVFSHTFTIAPIQPQHERLSSAFFLPLQPLYYAILSQPIMHMEPKERQETFS